MGVEIPDTVQGYDLSKAARNEGGIEPTSTYIANQMPFPGDQHDGGAWRGVRTKTHTYVEDEDGPWLLYDNAADPYQQTNLIGSPDAARTRRELHEELVAWMAEIGDDGASKEELVARFGYEVDERGVVPYYNEVGLHAPDNEG
jgi:arylsulfatase A-like enzyme